LIPRTGTLRSGTTRRCESRDYFWKRGASEDDSGSAGSGGSRREREGLDGLVLLFKIEDVIARGVDEVGSDEDDKVCLEVLIDIRAERAAEERDIAEDRHLVLDLWTSSLIRPPRTTVWPSHTVTAVVTLRVEKMGWLMTFGVRTTEVGAFEMAAVTAPMPREAGLMVLMGLP